jgi:hypothetical protein
VALSPVLVAKGVADFDATATALTPAFPAGVLPNDIAIAVHFSDSTTAATWPGGWTTLTQATTTNWQSQVAWKRCDGTEDGTTISLAQAGAIVKGAQIWVFRHCIASGTPFEDFSNATSTSTSATSNSTTTTGVDRLVVRITTNSDDVPGSTPAGYTSPVVDVTTLGNDGAITLDFKVIPTATTDAASTRTITSGAFTVHDFALLPLATAPTFVFNSADKSSDQDLTNSDKTSTQSGDAITRTVRTTLGHHVGKYVVTLNAIVVTADGFQSCGLSTGTFVLDNTALGANTLAYGFWDDASRYFNAVATSDTPGWATGDTVTFAWDNGNNRAWIRVNGGNWNSSGTANPATNTGGIDISGLIVGARFFTWSTDKAGDTATLAPTASVPSGFTDLVGAAAVSLTADIGAFAFAGQTAGLLRGRVVDAESGPYAFTGQAAGLARGQSMVAESGAYALAGQAAGLLTARSIAAAAGAYTLAGTAGLLYGRLVGAASGSFAFTGQDAELRIGRAVVAGSGAYTLAGQDAGLLTAYKFGADAGAYALTGQDAILYKTAVGATILAAEAGAYSVAAPDATLSVSTPVEPPIELPGGGGGSRAYRRRLRESIERRRAFEDEREKRIAALTVERPPLVPAPETVTMIERVLYEPITRPLVVEPAPQQEFEDDGGEEELLLLLAAD